MAQIMLGNLPPEVTVDELRAMLTDLGVPNMGEITLAEGLSDRIAALITIDLSDTDVGAIARQLEGHMWRQRTLSCGHTSLGWGN